MSSHATKYLATGLTKKPIRAAQIPDLCWDHGDTISHNSASSAGFAEPLEEYAASRGAKLSRGGRHNAEAKIASFWRDPDEICWEHHASAEQSAVRRQHRVERRQVGLRMVARRSDSRPVYGVIALVDQFDRRLERALEEL